MPKGKYIITAEIRNKISSARKVVLDRAKAHGLNLSTFLASYLNIWKKSIIHFEHQAAKIQDGLAEI